MIGLTSKYNRSDWIWVSKFLFGDPTGGLYNDPQHFDKVPNLFRETNHIPLREGVVTEGTETQMCRADGYRRAASFMSQRHETHQTSLGEDGKTHGVSICTWHIPSSLPYQNASYSNTLTFLIIVQDVLILPQADKRSQSTPLLLNCSAT